MKRSRSLFVLSFPILLLCLPGAVSAEFDPDRFEGMKARSIGPAGMSGRVSTIDAVVSDPDVVWIGAASGGVWKSVNGGLTWEAVFDDQPVASIGAVTVNQQVPDIVWVGTGEGNPRNSVSVGEGVYRSPDGGRTWEHLGLDRTERIHRIVLHPRRPEIAYVAAMGRAWGENPERGVFRTLDGGATWEKVLYVDERTGAADLAVDPSNPRRLLAAMWDYRREPWTFRSGGPGSGLYLTVDGGDSWERLTEEDGIPEGDLGRIGLAFAPSDPEIAYAWVEAEKNLILRSTDGGRTWKDTGAKDRFGIRPFYFADLRVDPEYPDRLYSLWSLVSVSDDGGKTWEILVPSSRVHPDHHAMWIHPGDGRHILLGNDGGVAISRDRGRNWRFVQNLPLAQYYHVQVDMDVPYHVYGGLQDNGSWRGPGEVWENGGIRNHHWQEVGFGDGFETIPDPADSSSGYSMSQEGYLLRWNLRTGERKSIRPSAPEGEELRFSWNAGLALDPFEAGTVYFGSQFLHRSDDRGETWAAISPDLTTDNPEWQKQADSGGLTPDVTGAENFTTIVAVAPSPAQRGTIWVGTDDGRIQLTRNAGETWTSVEKNLKGVPQHTWVAHIEPSRFDAASAYAVLDNHRRSDWNTFIARTTDFGRSWKLLAVEGVRGYALTLAEDPVDPDLLFLGTEFGLWFSADGGKRWMRWTAGLPTAPVRDLEVHPRDHDLVIATHGRGIFILDDIGPLRGLTGDVLAEPLHLFPVPAARQHIVAQTGESRFPGHGEFRGENRPYGALITYSIHLEEFSGAADGGEDDPETGRGWQDGKENGPRVRLRILDGSGEMVRTFHGPARPGINRAVWDLRRDPFDRPKSPDRWWDRDGKGPEVPAGGYTVEVEFRDASARGELRVEADPRLEAGPEDRAARWAAVVRAGTLQERAAEAIRRIRRTGTDIDVVLEKAAQRWDPQGKRKKRGEDPDPAHETVKTAAKALRERLDEVEKLLWRPPGTKGITAREDALSRISRARRFLASSWSAPTDAQLGYLSLAETTTAEALVKVDEVLGGPLDEFRTLAREHALELLPDFEPMTDADGADPEHGGV